MKKLSYAIAISMSVSCAAYAGQNSAFDTLLAGAAGAELSVPVPQLPLDPDRALASDVLDLTPNYADFLSGYAGSLGYKVFELDGARMTAKPALLDYATRALSLPGVPENWDAMIDYLGELRSIHRNNHILIVVRNSDRISRADAALYADLREVAEFACRNAREWSKGEITMKFAFVR
ncbi:MAG: barstar family protein [Elusimicrobiales bacterium]